MNPDHIERALAGLPRFDSDERRAVRTRWRCHAALQRRAPAAVRAATPMALRILQPIAFAGGFLFLALIISHAARIVRFTPW